MSASATVESVRVKYEAQLKVMPGVVGVGHSSDRIFVYLSSEDYIKSIPATLDGIPVQCVVTGPVKTF